MTEIDRSRGAALGGLANANVEEVDKVEYKDQGCEVRGRKYGTTYMLDGWFHCVLGCLATSVLR